MTNGTTNNSHGLKESVVLQRFLDTPGEETFADLFRLFSPKLVAFFKARGFVLVAEDLAQEVMLTVCSKAGQVRDHTLFGAWIFRIARNTLSRHCTRQTHEIDTLDLAEVPEGIAAISSRGGGAPEFEFNHWMDFLDEREKEAVTLRFVEEWEYRQIAAAQNVPIGTAKWRVFNAKRKLAPLLKRVETSEKITLRRPLKAA
jgi:RNA polymerase sigma-70 factor, ECF subfamily